MSSNPQSDVSRMDKFTSNIHASIYSDINPACLSLSSPFIACIIGASTGIGEHIAYAYAKAGATGIILASRRLEPLEQVARKCREVSTNRTCHVEAQHCDIASSDSVKRLAAIIQQTFGRLDVLISNPGYAGPVTLRITDGDPEDFQRCFEVNVMGTYHAAHHFIPLLLSSTNGAKAFITIGSLAACILRGPIANTGYCVSKMAQSRLTEFLAEQYGDEGLLSVNVHPGAVLTEMAAGNTPEEFLPHLTDDVDLCGGFVVWLTKETKEKHWMNGRFLSATWDVGELMARKEEIVTLNLLKWKMGAG